MAVACAGPPVPLEQVGPGGFGCPQVTGAVLAGRGEQDVLAAVSGGANVGFWLGEHGEQPAGGVGDGVLPRGLSVDPRVGLPVGVDGGLDEDLPTVAAHVDAGGEA